MYPRPHFLILCSIVALAPVAAEAGLPTALPWVERPDDGLRGPISRQVLGQDLEAADWPEGFWVGDMYIGPDSFAEQQLKAMGIPLPAGAYEPTPGVLFLAMDGLTLRSYCGRGDSANAAANCSALVDNDTNFPAYGSSSEKDSLQQTVEGYFAAFDLVITQNRPPDYLAYTMAVIGGTSANAGQGGGTCGVANVSCDGLKRNHVSLTFPSSCPGTASTVGQETAHNWGLEHTDVESDLLYPYNTGGTKSFRNECMDIVPRPGGKPLVCSYIHEIYCPAGGGTQQNSQTELLGVFGPRTPDSTAPEIMDMQPIDGSEFVPADTIQITARVVENSNFAGVRWTWLNADPSIANEDGTYTRCTNNMCDDEMNLGLDIDFDNLALDFINLNGAPPGMYSFRLEVMDAYGNSDMEEVTFTVVGDGTTPTGTDTSTTTTTTAGSDGSSDGGGGTGTGPGPGTETGGGTSGPEETTGAPTATGPTGGGTMEDPNGCACQARFGNVPVWAAFGLLPFFARRRRGD